MYKQSGFHLPAFFGGPIWYIAKGLYLKGIILFIIVIGSLFFGLPFIALYCGFKGRRDLYEKRYRQKARVNIDSL